MARSFANAMRTGTPRALYGNIDDNPAGQYNAIFGGNTKLKPETANSVTFGIVLQPLKDLSVTVDFFDIKVKDAIAALDPTVTLQQCLDTGNPFFCSKIKRDEFGTLWTTGAGYIEATNFNVAKYSTSGIDFGADYRMKLAGMGQLDFTLNGTLLRKLENEPITGLGTYDCAGLFGASCGTPSPKWRHKLRTTWTTPWNMGLSATWRYFGAVKNELGSDNPFLSGDVQNVNAKFKAYNYFDVAASYNISKNLTARLAINNLFDKDPPISDAGAPFGNGNTYPVVYDALGRRFSINLSASF